MVLNFPSGKASVSIRELQKHQQTQRGCDICNRVWTVDDECIANELHFFHLCQHVVGSHCWSSMADKQKGKCPVCNVQILCDERIYVHATVDRCAPASPNARVQEPETFLILAQDPPSRAQALNVEDGEQWGFTVAGEKKEDTDDVEVDTFGCFIDLCARADYIRDGLDLLRASSNTLTPIRWDRMTSFFANTAHAKKGSKRQKTDVAMFSSGGPNFTMNDVEKTLSSAEDWIKKNLHAIYDGRGIANKDAIFLRELNRKLVGVQAEIQELKDLKSREIARRQEAEFEERKNHDSRENARYQEAVRKMDIREINKKADEEVLRIRAEADDRILEVRAKASAEIAKLQSHGNVLKM